MRSSSTLVPLFRPSHSHRQPPPLSVQYNHTRATPPPPPSGRRRPQPARAPPGRGHSQRAGRSPTQPRRPTSPNTPLRWCLHRRRPGCRRCAAGATRLRGKETSDGRPVEVEGGRGTGRPEIRGGDGGSNGGGDTDPATALAINGGSVGRYHRPWRWSARGGCRPPVTHKPARPTLPQRQRAAAAPARHKNGTKGTHRLGTTDLCVVTRPHSLPPTPRRGRHSRPPVRQ